jgi:hypothetical protein
MLAWIFLGLVAFGIPARVSGGIGTGTPLEKSGCGPVLFAMSCFTECPVDRGKNSGNFVKPFLHKNIKAVSCRQTKQNN